MEMKYGTTLQRHVLCVWFACDCRPLVSFLNVFQFIHCFSEVIEDDDCRNWSNFVFVFGTKNEDFEKVFYCFQIFFVFRRKWMRFERKTCMWTVFSRSGSRRPLSCTAATFPAGANQIRLARRPKFGWRRRRRNSTRPRERRHITLLVSLSMEHVVSTASVVTVGYFGAH